MLSFKDIFEEQVFCRGGGRGVCTQDVVELDSEIILKHILKLTAFKTAKSSHLWVYIQKEGRGAFCWWDFSN